MFIMQVLASQLHFLANRNTGLAIPPLFWPVNCIKIGGHVVLLSCPTVDSLYCAQQCNVVLYVYADLCSLLAATSQFSILIGQNMQLTGCHNGNEMRNATCADTQISIEWPYCSFPILWFGLACSVSDMSARKSKLVC